MHHLYTILLDKSIGFLTGKIVLIFSAPIDAEKRCLSGDLSSEQRATLTLTTAEN